jgi:hypothetical protein
MFATLSLNELKQLVRALKDNHNIAGFSRMKKDDLIKALSARFVFLHGAIYLKYEDEDRAESQRIQNELDKAEAPAVEPKKAKPRAKKNATKEQLKRKFISFLDSTEIGKAKPTAIIKQFLDKESIDIGENKPFFMKVLKEWAAENK